MEHNFEAQTIPCLQWEIYNSKNQEQVLEVKLPDGFPDIGNVVGSWGQCIIREKDWRDGSISVNGFVMAQILYHPLDADEPQIIEAMLPFRESWEIDNKEREGGLRVHCYIKSIDARMLSERKMMVRAAIAVYVEALVPSEVHSYSPDLLPDDIQLLHREYPVMLLKEIAEKNIMIDEDIATPGIERIISCLVVPKISRQQVVGDKLSLVGIAQCHLLYSQDNGTLTVRDEEIEFSHVTDVGQVYDSDTQASVMPAVYSLEYEKMEGRVRLKCGIVCQYLIMDHINLDIIEDAYSPVRAVTLQETRCQFPAVLDIKNQNLQTKATLNISGNQIIASNLMMDSPILQRGAESMKMLLNGGVQVLFQDVAGDLQCSNGKWSVQMELNAANSVDFVCSVIIHHILRL